ncbi:MAG TPA: hypothetical protein VKP69_02250 [Isosphaeraceae bacterium]|nr:hypothetical protein [Isosphaeraceae bacterium]
MTMMVAPRPNLEMITRGPFEVRCRTETYRATSKYLSGRHLAELW